MAQLSIRDCNMAWSRVLQCRVVQCELESHELSWRQVLRSEEDWRRRDGQMHWALVEAGALRMMTSFCKCRRQIQCELADKQRSRFRGSDTLRQCTSAGLDALIVGDLVELLKLVYVCLYFVGFHESRFCKWLLGKPKGSTQRIDKPKEWKPKE